MKLSNRIETLKTELQKDIFEKNIIFDLSILAMLAGESIFLLGRPGIAKSLIARRIKYAFENANEFEYLMNRFSTPEEIFGPISIKALQNGSYERLTKGYLPTANVAFLDEIWKAGPSIQNTLLTIINEKLYRNGGKDIKVPLKILISASNELPAEGEGLEALFDRFIVRYIAVGLKNEKNFRDMVNANTGFDISIDKSLVIKEKEYNQWLQESNDIKISENIYEFVQNFRKRIHLETDGNAYISDRRWKKIFKLMKTSAFFNDRKAIALSDLLIIPHCIWDDEDQQEDYTKIFSDYIIDYLNKDYNDAKKQVNNKLIEIANQLNEMDSDELVKNLYSNPFAGELKGNYYRLINPSNNFPICFIAISDYKKIRKNNNFTAPLYFSNDLSHLEEKMKKSLSMGENNTLIDIDSNEVYKIEIQDSQSSETINKLNKEVDKLKEELEDKRTKMLEKKVKLKKERNIFFEDAFSLFINRAFLDDDIETKESTN